MEAVRLNERLRAAALMIRNGATLVAAAAIAKLYAEGWGIAVAVWLVSASAMTYIGVQALVLLQPED